MNVILILILVSLALALTFLVGFVWAVKSGQFEDTCTPSLRLLSEEERTSAVNQNNLAKRSKHL
jgi:cbb3-type cytochrome oxidase maturation protein